MIYLECVKGREVKDLFAGLYPYFINQKFHFQLFTLNQEAFGFCHSDIELYLG